ncbi:MAG TPA: M48 family metallopeptidase [Paracoccaceae bacterium]
MGAGMRIVGLLAAVWGLAGCVQVMAPPQSQLQPQPAAVAAAGAVLTPAQAARNFVAVVSQVEPVAEAICRARTRGVNCDLQIVVDERLDLPPNAFQTLDRQGRPVVGFTLALIADARNADELAFVLGHEAAHHIAGHIPRQRQTAMAGAVMAGVLASMSGADAQTVRRVQDIGANVGARTYSKEFELEADALGTEISWQAGFDPLRGAAFFDRLPDPGDAFLGSHPPNAQRRAVVARVMAGLGGR